MLSFGEGEGNEAAIIMSFDFVRRVYKRVQINNMRKKGKNVKKFNEKQAQKKKCAEMQNTPF